MDLPDIDMWTSRFDAVYLLHETHRPERLRRVMLELARVGIAQSGIFGVRYTTSSRCDDMLIEKMPGFKTRSEINEAMAYFRILSEALETGKERILFLEDDASFLNDLGRLCEIVSKLPDSDYVLLDHSPGIGFHDFAALERYRKMVSSGVPNDEYFVPDDRVCRLWLCTAVALTRKAMERLVGRMEDRGLLPIDRFNHSENRFEDLSYACSATPICKQREYPHSRGKLYKWFDFFGIDLEDYHFDDPEADLCRE